MSYCLRTVHAQHNYSNKKNGKYWYILFQLKSQETCHHTLYDFQISFYWEDTIDARVWYIAVAYIISEFLNIAIFLPYIKTDKNISCSSECSEGLVLSILSDLLSILIELRFTWYNVNNYVSGYKNHSKNETHVQNVGSTRRKWLLARIAQATTYL